MVFYKYLSDKYASAWSVLLEEPTEDLEIAQNLYVKSLVKICIMEDLLEWLTEWVSYPIWTTITFTAQLLLSMMGSFQLRRLWYKVFRDIEHRVEDIWESFWRYWLYILKNLGTTPQKQIKQFLMLFERIILF